MHRRPSLTLGAIDLVRRADLTAEERASRVLAPIVTRAVLQRGDGGVLAARDALLPEPSGAITAPTPEDIEAARRQIEVALSRGDVVGIRRRRGPPVGIAIGDDFETATSATPIVEQAPTWFEATIVDGAGQPIPTLDVVLSFGGERRKLPTDARGVVRLRDVTASTASLRIGSAAAAREALRGRVVAARSSKNDDDEDGVRLVVGRDDLVASLQPETPRTIALVKPLDRVRLVGMHFDTNKSFLRESAMRGIRRVVEVYTREPSGKLLIVGHTDTVGREQYNLDLSVERGEAVKAYLQDDVDAWDAWFGEDRPPQKRWGDVEINHMIAALPCEQSIAGFQQFSNESRGTALVVDGVAGPKTRRALIEAYMALDGTTLPDGIDAVVHGCGEFFPEDPTADEVDDAENRRVEIFCFDDEITPPAPGKRATPGEPQYAQWKDQVTETIDFEANADLPVIVGVFAPDGVDVELELRDIEGATKLVMPMSLGERDGDRLDFSVDPHGAPNPAQIVVSYDRGTENDASVALTTLILPRVV